MRFSIAVAVFLLFTTAGCGGDPPETDYVARVGDALLLESEVQRAMRAVPPLQDSTDVRRQIVEQWVTNEILHQEALRRGLQTDEDVQRLLEESERSVLVNALISRLYAENDVRPSPSELQAYFEQHREQLRLREPFVRVRYLQAESRPEAEQVRRLIQQAPLSDRDSVFLSVAPQFGTNASEAIELASGYHPVSRVFADNIAVRETLQELTDGQTAPVIATDSAFHILQLAERIPAGSIPELAWIESELERRLVIQNRKQLYARQVQRLRNEALAREELEVE